MKNLVIVESPTKAKTLERFLGEGFQIEASMGHVRDLPKSEFGVDVKKDFEPQYVIPRDKRKRVNELKKLAENAKTLWIATDPDREGEAIAWHISQLLGNSKVQNGMNRVVFHEITEEAIEEAFKHPQNINLRLVDAQQARRVLDRLVGYKLSPLLWQKVKRGLSAGRVQSVALRLIVEREREIGAFKPEEYWSIEAELAGEDNEQSSSSNEQSSSSNEQSSSTAAFFHAGLIERYGKKLSIKNEKEAKSHLENLEGAKYSVSKINKKEVRRYPSPPFTTSTLQQTSSNKLGFLAKKTMMLAQALYEHGFITYMRTDSINLSVSSISSVRNYIVDNFGKNYLPSSPRVYKSKSKNAQEAHEAIRPTNVKIKSDELRVKSGMTRDHVRLYELIWKRFIACQMIEALINQTTVDIQALDYLFRATGSLIKFEGWLKLYGKESETALDEQTQDNQGSKNQVLPELTEGELLKLLNLLPTQHFTQPPPRYNEASLIKKLEELGIGRPSTYAPIISTIQERFYVEREERKFIPTVLGFAVTDFVMKYFPNIVDYAFTAQMEDELDNIASGESQWRPVLREFYGPFEKKIEETGNVAEKVKMAVEVVDKKCPECGKDLVVRIGRFGKFLACSGFPECKYTETIQETVNAKCPDCGGDIVTRKTRRGKTFYGCKNWPGCKFASWTKPKS